MHLAGPAPAVRRLTLLAGELGIAHEVAGGVLRVPVDASGALIDAASKVLAPLEAALVHVVRTDLAAGTPASLLTVACAAPTIAQLAARRRNRRLLDAIASRRGVSIGFQPIVELCSGRTVAFEGLLRVRLGHSDVSPSEVLSAADEAGRLVEVDAVGRSVALHHAAPTIGDRLLMLNLLPASLPVPAEQLAPFAAEVDALGLARNRIVLESPVGPPGALRRQVDAVFTAMRGAGFLVGLDNVRSRRDLDAVKTTPDYVKLDRSLVRGLPSASGTRALGNVMRDCEHSGAVLVAQGVESPEQLDAVRDLGVQYAQGWALGRPGAIPAETIATC